MKGVGRHGTLAALVLTLSLLVSVLVVQHDRQSIAAQPGSILPLSPTDQALTPGQLQAQALALADAQVQGAIAGHRAEVFGVYPMADPYPAMTAACADGACYQVNIYDYEANAAVLAIAQTGQGQVLDVFHLPGSHPLINARLYDLAVEIMRNDPEVIAALGLWQPAPEQIRVMEGNHFDTICDGRHLCAGATFSLDSGTVWVLVDLTEEKVAKLWWSDRQQDAGAALSYDERAPQDCGTTIHLDRDGWSLDYLTTPSDSLRVSNVWYNYNGVESRQVASSIKLLEWHAHYPGNWGYVDYTGCGATGGGHGYHINPYGPTQVQNLYDPNTDAYVGFEVVQDFRMGNWGQFCNYRYEQHFQFYSDGRWRVVTGAYGRGCGNGTTSEATYRPIVRIDVAVNGDDGDSFSAWDGLGWPQLATEQWYLQGPPYTSEGYRYRVTDQSGDGFFIEPGQGQFDDAGTGDNAYLYVTQHHASEGEPDMPSIGVCCNNNYQQGPHNYLNGESVAGQNLVLWYVPQSQAITTWQVINQGAPVQYCWTDNVNSTWPCFSGPMFVPVCASAPAVVVALSGSALGDDLLLSWPHHPANRGGYELWRSQNPNFTPGDPGSTKLASGMITSYTDANILGNVLNEYTYILRSENCNGSLTANSPAVGEREFNLAPGSAP